MWTLSSTAGAEWKAGNCRQPLFGRSSLPFSLLLRLSQEFPRAIQEIPNKTFILDSHRPFICNVGGLSCTPLCFSWQRALTVPRAWRRRESMSSTEKKFSSLLANPLTWRQVLKVIKFFLWFFWKKLKDNIGYLCSRFPLYSMHCVRRMCYFWQVAT
jgi:hypothetical protein